MSIQPIRVAEVFPLHCAEAKTRIFDRKLIIICPHRAPMFYCEGMMYPEPVKDFG